ncbi:divalent-cation tolerance protein CutA [Streptomyces sp. CAU 1734]|uniref:divalent-cation tolerance protein CutA n=1 Tax=Streptomyces sp. CAU 1734 TaxID=3140360 RepID=UPI00325FF392
MTAIVLAQTTTDSEEAAMALARGAVEGRLAACAHVDPPITAVYRWEGNVAADREWRVSYKTPRTRLPELAQWVAEHHGYDTPEWIVLPIDGGSEAYLSWVETETAQ